MAVGPNIRAVDYPPRDSAESAAGPTQVRFELSFADDLHYLQGHFRDCPLLPGVVQLTWAIDLARQHLPVRGEFTGVSSLKFMRVIQPGQTFALNLQLEADGALSFEYRTREGPCASGTVAFAM